MNKKILCDTGFEEELKMVDSSRCPCCGEYINPATEFADDISLVEYKISGLCQSCQRKVFKEVQNETSNH